MSALAALQEYTSSSDENDHDEENTTHQASKQSQTTEDVKSPVLPSLPPEILQMFDDSARIHPVGGDHQGRIRSFEHVPGNWATYVYIPVELTEEFKTLIEDVLSATPSSVDMKPVEDLHISISKTVTLQYQWIEPFVDSLSQRLAAMNSFTYCFQDIEFYVNDEKTRSFMGLRVGYGHQEILHVVKVIDTCLAEFSLPEYYKDPSFHVSFVWCLSDYTHFLDSAAIAVIQERCRKLCSSILLPIAVNEVWCKAGCKRFRIQLGRCHDHANMSPINHWLSFVS